MRFLALILAILLLIPGGCFLSVGVGKGGFSKAVDIAEIIFTVSALLFGVAFLLWPPRVETREAPAAPERETTRIREPQREPAPVREVPPTNKARRLLAAILLVILGGCFLFVSILDMQQPRPPRQPGQLAFFPDPSRIDLVLLTLAAIILLMAARVFWLAFRRPPPAGGAPQPGESLGEFMSRPPPADPGGPLQSPRDPKP